MKTSDIKTIDGKLLADLIVTGAATLKKHVQEVNDLNVFPIPDGDTGDNMYHTIFGGLSGLTKSTENDLGKKANALSDAMLLNARGNSGVILSQLFHGITNGLKNRSSADVLTFAKAFDEGVKTAYLAVVKPVEGTILTVARESVAYAVDKVNDDKTLIGFLDDMLYEMKRSVERTPDLLPVLKEAGVVDSGGVGLYYIIKGMRSAAAGKVTEKPVEQTVKDSCKEPDYSLFDENSVMTYGYCTEFLLRLQTSKTDVNAFNVQTFIDYLETIGDSIVAIKTGTVVKIHVHTLTPYKVLEFAQRYGEFLKVKIENMTLQHNETLKTAQEEVAFTKSEKPRKKFGVVAVANGEGLKNMLTELGADEVIDGGQTSNPSSEDFINSFERINAEYIFVMPNNGNIILTAKQAANIYKDAEIRVIETKNVGDCYAALSMADFTVDTVEDAENILLDNMQGVVTGMISPAVRDALLNGVDIKKGDYIGFTDKTVYVSEKDKIAAYKRLTEKIGIQEKPFLITIFGKDVSEEEKNSIRAYVGTIKNLEYYDVDGGQGVYDFILIAM